MKTVLSAARPRTQKYVIPAIIFILIALVGVFAFYTQTANPASLAISGRETISPSALEARYGLHLNLVALSAAGGLVDVRFKVLDSARARALLEQPENFPTLMVAGSPAALSVPEEGRPAEFPDEDGATLFLLYPNAGNLVTPGTPVTIAFGELQLEPVPAR